MNDSLTKALELLFQKCMSLVDESTQLMQLGGDFFGRGRRGGAGDTQSLYE